jgi:hypothetical protein
MVQSSMRISSSLRRFCSSTGNVGLETRGAAAGLCAGAPGVGSVEEAMVEEVFRVGFVVASEIFYLGDGTKNCSSLTFAPAFLSA